MWLAFNFNFTTPDTCKIHRQSLSRQLFVTDHSCWHLIGCSDAREWETQVLHFFGCLEKWCDLNFSQPRVWLSRNFYTVVGVTQIWEGELQAGTSVSIAYAQAALSRVKSVAEWSCRLWMGSPNMASCLHAGPSKFLYEGSRVFLSLL